MYWTILDVKGSLTDSNMGCTTTRTRMSSWVRVRTCRSMFCSLPLWPHTSMDSQHCKQHCDTKTHACEHPVSTHYQLWRWRLDTSLGPSFMGFNTGSCRTSENSAVIFSSPKDDYRNTCGGTLILKIHLRSTTGAVPALKRSKLWQLLHTW